MKDNDCEHPIGYCQMPPGHDDDVDCHFVCDDCGEEFEAEGRCLRAINFRLAMSTPVSAREYDPTLPVPKEASQIIGETIMEYALAEHTLRGVLKQLPDYNDRSFINQDLERLEKWLPEILNQSSGEAWKTAFDKCVKELRSAFDVVRPKRNTLAHGQLHSYVSETFPITASGSKDAPAEPSERWYTLRRDNDEITLDESELSQVLAQVKELRAKVGALQRVAGFQRPLSDSDTL